MSDGLVSVVIPCYNSDESLHYAIDSIVNQSVPVSEIIVVDDGSTSKSTLNILNSIHNVTLLRHSENLGLAAARNTGFHHSNTEYVLFLDSDDRLAIDAIEKLLLAMKSCSKKAFAFSNIQLEGERKAEISSKYLPFTQRFINKIPYCILLRKSDLASTTIYREEFRCGLEDWELNVRLISLGFTPVHVDEPLFYYSVSSNGMLRLRTIRLFAQILKQIIASNKDFYRPRYLFHDFLHQIRQQGFHSVFASLLVLLGLIFLPSKLFNLLLRLWLDKTQD